MMTDLHDGTLIALDISAAHLLAEADIRYRNEKVTLRDLLRMSSGMISSDSSDQEVFIAVRAKLDGSQASKFKILLEGVQTPLKKAEFRRPGGRRSFNYSGFGTQLLGTLVEHRLKSIPRVKPLTLDGALKHFFWQKLHVRKKAEWKLDFAAHPSAYCCLYMSAGGAYPRVLSFRRPKGEPSGKSLFNILGQQRARASSNADRYE